jgi:hypothetical protein
MPQRRASNRMPMKLPVEIRWKSRAGTERQAWGKIADISGTGLFIEVAVRPRRETPVSLKVLLPRQGKQAPLELWCQGRVVRWNERGRNQGLGAVIDDYELRPARRDGPAAKRPPKGK